MGNNVMRVNLSEKNITSEPLSSNRLSVADCPGEAVHIYMRNIRISMSVQDFDKFAQEVSRSDIPWE